MLVNIGWLLLEIAKASTITLEIIKHFSHFSFETVFQGNKIVDERKVFIMEELLLIKTKEKVILENHHIATLTK